MPAVTDPPGLLMYSQMSEVPSSPSRYSSCAQIWLAMSSLTSVPSMTTRFFSNRLNTSLRGSNPGSSAMGTVMSDMRPTLPPALRMPLSNDRVLVEWHDGGWRTVRAATVDIANSLVDVGDDAPYRVLS